MNQNLPNDFNSENYKKLNLDLSNLTNNQLEYHYLHYGKNENRKYQKNLPYDFNPKIYKKINQDLNNLNSEQLIFHYINCGYFENRRYKISLPDDFNIELYKKIYPELINLNDDEIVSDYLENGFLQNKIYKIYLPTDFNLEFYKKLNSDLVHLKNEELIQHYIENGYFENRLYNVKLPIDFNPEIYKKLNYDLNYLKNKEVIYHYINYGYFENRPYKIDLPNDFCIKMYRNLNKDLYNLSDEELEIHYVKYGNSEKREYKKNFTNNLLNNINISEINEIYEIPNINNNIIFSLTSIPPRFIDNNFELVLDSLYHQILKPKFIIVNLCEKYNRDFQYDVSVFYNKIEEYKQKYDNLIINFTNDYGPITKILGLYNISSIFNDNDMIIILDDDWLMKNTTTYFYNLTYQLYNCDCVFIDEKYIIDWNNNMQLLLCNEILYDNYQNSAFGWLSYSFKYKYISKLYNFYTEIIEKEDNIIKHDDLIITLFYKLNKLYACGMNLFLNIYERLNLENIDALKDQGKAWSFRFNLEEKMYNTYNIEHTLLREQMYIKNLNINNSEIYIEKNILPRNLLFNIENINYNPEENNFYKKQIDIKYFTNNTYILTLTYYDDLNINEDLIYLNIDNKNLQVYIRFDNNFSNKKTYFFKTNIDLIKSSHKKYDFNILQTNNENKISINKFYSINSILSYMPDINYTFYKENDRINFISSINQVLLNIYNKLNVGAYKADFFRALYIYINGGLYLDCKNILYCNLNNILNKNECYVQDLNSGICNGFIYCSLKKDIKIKNYLIEMIYNIFNSLYLSSCLEITGPYLFTKFINDNIYLKNNIINNDWKNSYFTDINTNNIVIKVSYNNYYDENNYLMNNHYSTLYEQRNVYNNINIDYKKINGIDAILWINLERSENRRNNMEKILQNINIPNFRINAIDGKNNNVRDIISIQYERELSNYEIACTLSHLKAVNYLKNLEGEYFMICEDDISLDTILLFNNDLNDIIKKSPKFDILLINKIWRFKFDQLYPEWNDYWKNNMQIAGAGCYIISRCGINKIINNAEYIDDDNFIFNTNKKFDVSDIYLYANLETFVYKYNFISMVYEESTIHDDHLMANNLSHNFHLREIITNLL